MVCWFRTLPRVLGLSHGTLPIRNTFDIRFPITLHRCLFWLDRTDNLFRCWRKFGTLPRSRAIMLTAAGLAPLHTSHTYVLHCTTGGTRLVSSQLFPNGQPGFTIRCQSRRRPGSRVDERLMHCRECADRHQYQTAWGVIMRPITADRSCLWYGAIISRSMLG